MTRSYTSLLLCLLVASSLLASTGGQEAKAAAAAALNNNNKDVFDLLDGNHDGRMDRNEFNQAVNQFEGFLRHHGDGGNDASPSWFGRSNAANSNSNNDKDLSFWNGFTSSVAMILATEIGDKTFFIAAVLSMKQDRRCIFGGAALALYLMTILSTLMGLILPQFLDRKYTHIMGGLLFGYFGVKLVYDSRFMADHKVSEELDEVEEELLQQNKKSDNTTSTNSSSGGLDDSDNNSNLDDDTTNNKSGTSGSDLENPMRNRAGSAAGGGSGKPPSGALTKSHRKKASIRRTPKAAWHMILLQSFTLTFVAEWGDRSQIATIALAAAKNPYGVTVGGCLGHSMCTGLAVLGGRMLAARISEKSVSQYGGMLFLVFGIHSLFFES